jgi:UDP-N-acetylmuramoyl-tripeptide--D-alanyl-D-alanine ligase
MDIEKLYAAFLETGKISTDSRSIVPGSIFFALKGERFNGNAFARSALDSGAAYAVVDEAPVSNERMIRVDSVLEKLQKLARYHRDQLTIPIIGLTGSNGKTTTKELVSVVLKQKFNTYATRGNLNNHIGVPLSILEIGVGTEIAVIEMGANHLGEIAALCAIANPTHGFITNIGKAHIGTFGGFENIVRAKSELYQHLIDNNGTVFINSSNEILANMAKRFKNPVLYPGQNDYYQCELINADPYIRLRADGGEIVQTNLLGNYNFENIAVALCIGKFFHVPPPLAHRAVTSYGANNMRSQLIRKNSNVIILDAYNANPSSMKAAIENLAAMTGKEKVAILGDMYELEEMAEEEHRNVGLLLDKYKFDKVYLCGKLMKAAHEIIPSATLYEDKEVLAAELSKTPPRHSLVLIKASRGMGLETLVESI